MKGLHHFHLNKKCEIWGLHKGEGVDYGLLDCDAVHFCGWYKLFGGTYRSIFRVEVDKEYLL
jgi:hypothetical protein